MAPIVPIPVISILFPTVRDFVFDGENGVIYRTCRSRCAQELSHLAVRGRVLRKKMLGGVSYYVSK